MGDFSFLGDNLSIRRRQPSSHQQGSGIRASASAPGSAHDPTAAAAGEPAAPRTRIALPSFREVQAAQRPSAPVSAFQPGFLNRRQQQAQQQQAQQQLHGQQPPNTGVPGGSGPGRPGLAQQQQQQQQPLHSNTFYSGGAGSAAAAAAVAAAGQSLSLNFQLPRYNQAAAGSGGAAAAPIGIARGAAAAAAAAAGPGGSYQQQQQQPGVAGDGSSTGVARPAQQVPPSNTVLVSQRQQGNPVLKHIRAVRWCFADVVPDYVCGANTAVLFLSLRYHLLQPEYILHRLAAVQRAYRLLVVLLLVDVEEVVKPLQELHKATMGADAVLMCAWSNEECARYVETFKAFENKTASSIMERTDTDYLGRLTSSLTAIRGINRSDAFTLASAFGSLAEVIQAEEEQFAACPGLGPIKAKRLVDTFNQPFKKTLSAVQQGPTGAAASQQQQQQQQQQSQQSQQPGQQQQQQQQKQHHTWKEGLQGQQLQALQHQQGQQPAQGVLPHEEPQHLQQQLQGDEEEDEGGWEDDVDLEAMYYAEEAAQDEEETQADEGQQDVATTTAGGSGAFGSGQAGLHEFLPLPEAEDCYYEDGFLEEF